MNHHIVSTLAMPAHTRFSLPAALLTMACALLAGCAGPTSPAGSEGMASRILKPTHWLTSFKPDVIQGNFISREQVQQLRPGMSRTEVRGVLGTPLVASIFHADRWDYIFTINRQGVPAQAYRYAVFFKGDALERFEGDTMPAEADFIARLDSGRALGKIPPLETSPEQLEAARKKAGMPAAQAPASGASSPVTDGSTAIPPNYPPLESVRP